MAKTVLVPEGKDIPQGWINRERRLARDELRLAGIWAGLTPAAARDRATRVVPGKRGKP